MQTTLFRCFSIKSKYLASTSLCSNSLLFSSDSPKQYNGLIASLDENYLSSKCHKKKSIVVVSEGDLKRSYVRELHNYPVATTMYKVLLYIKFLSYVC